MAFVPLLSFSQNNPVVIELFTSQGCSSCPAADKNLAEIIASAEANGQPVYGLSFHVDYWNYIGWKDPYSKSEYTARQRRYAQVMNSESVYTPQMVVNGEAEFVGSDKKTSGQAVARALAKKMTYQISLNNLERVGEKISVSYSLSKNPEGETVNVAMVERAIANEVTRGENAGRKLTHKNVVRSFVSVAAQQKGTITIDLPKGGTPCSIIVFVQNQEWHITGVIGKNIN